MHLLSTLLLVIQVFSPAWKEAPPSMPKGTKMAVLEGSPQQEGMFTIRLSVPAGARIAPHVHPRPERVTVLSGKVTVTIGGKSRTFTGGGFYVNPPGEVHSLTFHEKSVLQLTCEGPWVVRYVE